MTTTDDFTLYAIQHPNMSEALLVEASPARSKSGLKAQIALYVAQQFDVMLPAGEFVCQAVDSDTIQGFSLFSPTIKGIAFP